MTPARVYVAGITEGRQLLGEGRLGGLAGVGVVLRFRRSVRIEGNKAPIYLGGGAIAGISKPRSQICLPASDFHTALAA